MSTTQTHLTSQVKPRPELQASRVGIYCKTTGSVAGQTVITLFDDIWPTGAPSGLRSFDASLDLTGPRTSVVTGQVTAFGFVPTSVDFWTTHVPALDNASHPEIAPNSLAIVNPVVNPETPELNAISLVDARGNIIPYVAGQYNYLGGQGTVHPWMPVQTFEATVTGYLTYQKRKNIGTAANAVWVSTDKPNTHAHTVKLKLTTAPIGTTPYTLQTLLSTGETYPEWHVVLPSLAPVPAGTPGATLMTLAQNIYLTLLPLQYNFNHTILEQPFATVIKPGKHALNLSGGAAAWSTMAAMIQETTIEFTNSPASGLTIAKTSVRCGPVEHLEPGQLVQLFNLFQNRDVNKISPSERSSGLPNGGANTAMPSDTAKENTAPAQPDAALTINSAVDGTTGSTNINALTQDPANGQITLQIFPGGSAPSATPLLTGLMPPVLSNAGAPAAGTLAAGPSGSLIQYRAGWLYVDTNANALWRCVNAGTNAGSAWMQISGGSGGGSWSGVYNNVNAYMAGQMVVVQSTVNYSGTVASPGIYGCRVSVPAGGTANQVPQWPLPTTGTIYWDWINFLPEQLSACNGSGGTSLWIPMSGATE